MAYNGDVKRIDGQYRPGLMRRDQPRSIQADMLSVRLQDLFTRRKDGWGPRNLIASAQYVYGPMLDGRIRPRLVRIPARFMAEAMAMPFASLGRESREHQLLKRACRQWMRADGADDAKEEQWCGVGKADVYSRKREWIVECGNTSIAKLQDAILDDDRPRFTLVPFQNDTRIDGSPRGILGVEFDCDQDVRADMAAARLAGLGVPADRLKFKPVAPALSFAGGAF